ncbi:DUF1127 domain-containing protein [Agrobacterium vitis]|uniref:DUF1127 domain-containing protein n=1 Tax=Allorhizobium ampelinum TaxID=3025782 RepID=UPI001F3D3B7F|nr:DUF1127 domain-containing protein [Allorhizobium ampelinum]MCF1464585.1 DUF1127 domain-containing protein [Allorhizobium ampelinum]
MTHTTLRDSTFVPSQRSFFSRRAAHSVVRRILLWIERSRQRAALAELDDERLRDLGLCREDVARECARRFWQ